MKRKNEKKERKNHDSGRIWNDGISQSEERRKVMTFSKEEEEMEWRSISKKNL